MKGTTNINWHCPKCEIEYSTPQPVIAVLCSSCTRKNRGTQTWMKALTYEELQQDASQ